MMLPKVHCKKQKLEVVNIRVNLPTLSFGFWKELSSTLIPNLNPTVGRCKQCLPLELTIKQLNVRSL